MIQVPENVESLFVAAGWYPGRRASVDFVIPTGHPAGPVLLEFGGLKVGTVASGLECATSDVAFRYVATETKLVRLWSDLLGTRLVGVADVHHAHGEAYVDEKGRWFVIGAVDDLVVFVGASFGEALQGLLLGRRGRPILRPDQDRVTVYGETFLTGDPRIYSYP